MLKLVVLFALAQVILAQTPVKSCGNGKPLPSAVYFGGRDNFCTKPPCILKRGKTATLEIDFISPINSTTVVPKAKAKILGMSIDLDLGVQPATACKFLAKGCPIVSNVPTTFKLVKAVPENTMKATADVEYTLFGDHEQVVSCYKLKTTVL